VESALLAPLTLTAEPARTVVKSPVNKFVTLPPVVAWSVLPISIAPPEDSERIVKRMESASLAPPPQQALVEPWMDLPRQLELTLKTSLTAEPTESALPHSLALIMPEEQLELNSADPPKTPVRIVKLMDRVYLALLPLAQPKMEDLLPTNPTVTTSAEFASRVLKIATVITPPVRIA